MSLSYLRQGQCYQVEWSLCGLEHVHGNLKKLDESSKSTLSAQHVEISIWFLKDCRKKLNCVYIMPFSDRKSMVWLPLSLHSYVHADITNQLQILTVTEQAAASLSWYQIPRFSVFLEALLHLDSDLFHLEDILGPLEILYFWKCHSRSFSSCYSPSFSL